MAIGSITISIFRHRTTTTTPTPSLPSFNNLLRRVSTFHFHRLSSITAKQNPNYVSKKPPPNKHLLKAKHTSIKHFSSLSPVLTPAENPTLSPSQAIGTVASSQANFMRVIVQSLPSEQPSTSIGRDSGDASGSSDEEAKIGVELLCVVKAVLKKIKRRVLVGDKVVVGSIDWVDRRGMIENVFQRNTEIPDPPVANVDHLLVLFSMEQPRLEAFSLTRFLVEAESTGIPLTLALNKSELVEEETLLAWKSRLRSWGYIPIFCSVESKNGLDTLKFILREQTTVIVGPSGVGKSSLINALRSNNHVSSAEETENWFDPVGLLSFLVLQHFLTILLVCFVYIACVTSDYVVHFPLFACLFQIVGSKWFEDQRVGEISTRSGRGKHTTRHVSLLPLSGGGYLADTPGFNQPSLMKVTKQSLALAFPEIRKMLKASEPEKCSFNDCLHLGEPGCIVKGDWERYAYYLQLLDEIKIREEFQLRTYGTKKEGDVRYKIGNMGVQQAEPRLELKKHRRQSRKRMNQSILDDLDDDDNLLDDPVLRAMENENQ
ncbi:hypothetical protein L1049_007114 [Liquidambar formosana]|uniref:Uncharacterized protein n=1 Tax=Liquidambar formosana TaxID=63359 RepID=A0AAP0WS53_LIQFO